MSDHHPLGPAGGAGRVDDVSQVVRLDLVPGRIGFGPARLALICEVIHPDDGAIEPVQLFSSLRAGHDDLSLAVLQHEAHPLGRIPGVERQIRSTRLQNGQQCDGQIGGPIQADGHR